MIFMSQRRTEQRHDPIAHDLIDCTFIAVHCLHHVLQDWIENFPRFLGIAVGQQLHRALHVGEQHRDLLALAFEGTLGGENLFGEVLGCVSLGRNKLRGRGFCYARRIRTHCRIYLKEDWTLGRKGTATRAAPRTLRRILPRRNSHAGNEDTSWRSLKRTNGLGRSPIAELSSWKSSGQGLSNLPLRAYSSVEMISLLSHCSGSVAGCAHAQSGWMSFG